MLCLTKYTTFRYFVYSVYPKYSLPNYCIHRHMNVQRAFIHKINYEISVFNCIDWTYGFSNVVCINPDSEKLQVVNYLGSYLTKNCPAPYRCKRFFHTLNLDCRDTYLFNSCDNNEPLLRMIISCKGELENGDLSVKAFDEMCNAFELEKVRTSKNGECEVFRSNIDLQGYFDYFREVFTKKNA